MTTTVQRRLPRWLLGTGVIAGAMGVMNLATYGFTVLTARLLGPREYGAVAALMGVMLVLNVVSLGLMATAARRVSTAHGDASVLERNMERTGTRAALALGGATLLATPLLVAGLRLDSWLDGALMAVAIVPLTIMGAQAGILQGQRRWGALAAVFVAMGLGRLVLGGAAVLWRPDTTSAMAGVALGGLVPAVVAWRLLGRSGGAVRLPASAGTRAEPPGSLLSEVAHNSHALLAFFALSNCDVILSRTLLDVHDSGLYAAGVILAKAVLFLPQFVLVLVFPLMAASGGRHRTHAYGLLVVAALGACASIGAYRFSGLALLFVGGEQYADARSQLWVFAVIGTILALIQMLVYGTVARQHRSAVWVIWCGVLVLLAVAVLTVHSITGLLWTVAAVQLVVLAALLVIWLRRVGTVQP